MTAEPRPRIYCGALMEVAAGVAPDKDWPLARFFPLFDGRHRVAQPILRTVPGAHVHTTTGITCTEIPPESEEDGSIDVDLDDAVENAPAASPEVILSATPLGVWPMEVRDARIDGPPLDSDALRDRNELVLGGVRLVFVAPKPPADLSPIWQPHRREPREALRDPEGESMRRARRSLTLHVALSYLAFPIDRDGSVLHLAVPRHPYVHMVDDMKFLTGFNIELHPSNPASILHAIARFIDDFAEPELIG